MMLVYIGYNIFDGLTILLDHLLDTDGWLYFTLTVSFLWDTTALFIIPNIILWNSKYKNDSFWIDKDFQVKLTGFRVITNKIEPRRDFNPNINQMKRKRTLAWSCTNPDHIRYRIGTLEKVVHSKNRSLNNCQSALIDNQFKLSRTNSLSGIVECREPKINVGDHTFLPNIDC